MKTCSTCKEEKSLENFYNDRSTKSGKTSSCKNCITSRRDYTYNRAYQRKQREINKEEVNRRKRYWYQNQRLEKKIFYRVRARAKRKGIPFTLKLKDIVIPEKCPVLHVPLVIGTKENYEYTHSLDRLDNSKGYHKDNVLVMSMKANSMKNSGTPLELLALANWILGNDDIVRAADNLSIKTAEVKDKEPLR